MSGTTAFCLIEGDGETFKVLELFKEPKHKSSLECFDYLQAKLIEFDATLIGIDAPLTIPRKLYDSSYVSAPRECSGEIANAYLFRHTDYFLFKEFGLRPMPPAGDRIGRLTARMVELQAKVPALKSKIIEIYPKQIAQALNIVNYKKNPEHVFAALNLEKIVCDEHEIDALLAAFATMRIDKGHTIKPEGEDGWCYPLVIKY